MSSVFEENSYILVNEYPSCSGSGQENNPQRQHKIRRKKCKYMVLVSEKRAVYPVVLYTSVMEHPVQPEKFNKKNIQTAISDSLNAQTGAK